MGSKAPTTSSSTQAPAWLQQNLQDVQSRAQGVAATPYTPYSGQLTAGLNPTQQSAIEGLGNLANPNNGFTSQGFNQSTIGFNTAAGASPYYGEAAQGLAGANQYFNSAANSIAGAQPYYQQASNYNDRSTGPLNVQQYLSPYQDSVIDATMAQVNRQNAISQNQALGAGIKQGNAFGGDRAGLAAAQLASDQGINTNATLAGLNNSNWAQALGSAQNEMARYGQAAQTAAGLGNAQLQAGQGYNTVGNSAVSAANGLTGVGNAVVNQGQAQSGIGVQGAGIGSQYVNNLINQYGAALQGGTTAQQTQQTGLNADYQQYANAQGFPYQQTSWLSNIINGGAGAAGGTTTSTGSAPNVGSQIAGAATTAAALLPFLNRGGVVPERASGGAVSVGFPMAGGPIDLTSTPYGGGLIPDIKIVSGRLNAPNAMDPNKQGQGGSDMSKAIGGLGGAWDSFQARQRSGSSIPDALGATSFGGSNGPTPLMGFAKGGLVPDFNDRWSDVDSALSDFSFVPGKMATPRLMPAMPSAPVAPAADPIGPTDPTAEPFRLDGSYRSNPDFQTAPLTEQQAAARFNGTDQAPTGLGLPPEIARGLSRPTPEAASSVMAFDAPRGLVPANGIAPTDIRARNAGSEQRTDGTQPAGGLLGGLGVTEDGRQAMLSLGLGLLASRSPNFGTALGEAGLGAVGTFNDIHKQRVAQADKERGRLLEERRVDMEAQRLQQSMEAAKRDALASPLVSDGNGGVKVNPAYVALKRAEAAATADNRPLPGYRAKSDGSLEYIPGGPSDPEVIKRRTEAENKKDGPDEVYNQRKAMAERAGLKEGDPAFKSFMLTGKMPREDQAPLSATDKKAILEADEHVLATQATIDSLKRAKELSKKAYEGPLAAKRGYATSLLGSEGGIATEDLTNEVTTNALSSLKSIFGGNPTEGERAILLDIQGSVSKPDAVRQKIFDRAMKAAEKRLDFSKQRASEMRGGEYYKSDAKKSTSPTSPSLQNATPKVGEKKQFKQGTGVWNGQAWVPEGAQ